MDLIRCNLCHHVSGKSLDKSTCIVGKRGLKSLINANLQSDDGLYDFFLITLKRYRRVEDDEWAHQIYGRINTYVDLVVPEGKYHRSCMQVVYMDAC